MDCQEMSLSMQDALWAISYLCQDTDDQFLTQICQSKNMIQTLIHFMNSDLIEEHTPALRAIGNILTSDNQENIDLFIFHQGLQTFNKMMVVDQQLQLMKECMWGLSNITAGSENQIAAFLAEEELVNKVYMLANSTNIQIRREALFIFTNLILTTQMPDVRMNLVARQDYLLLKLFVQGLTTINDQNIILEILLAMDPVLALDKTFNLTESNSISYKFEIE